MIGESTTYEKQRAAPIPTALINSYFPTSTAWRRKMTPLTVTFISRFSPILCPED
jgi:hypothetical protein